VPAEALEIEARRQQSFRELSQTVSGAPLRILVLGRVRSILSGEGEGGLRLSHLPNEFVIQVEARTLGRLRQASEFAWINFSSLHPEFHLIVLFTMQRSDRGRWRVDELAGMVTTEDFIPTLSMEEALMAKRLVAEGRHFLKPLPYDAPAARIANFLLTDCGEKTVPLEILTRALGGGSAEHAARLARIAEYETTQRAHWFWNAPVDPLPPPLPPRHSLSSIANEFAGRVPEAHNSLVSTDRA
jgi:hypothetical protein